MLLRKYSRVAKKKPKNFGSIKEKNLTIELFKNVRVDYKSVENWPCNKTTALRAKQ